MNRTIWIPFTLCAMLCACSPPSVRQRVDVQIRADGACLMEGQAVVCKDAGALAASKYSAGGVSAVLLIDQLAPHDSVLAVRTGLQKAHIAHVQYGDPAHLGNIRPGEGLD